MSRLSELKLLTLYETRHTGRIPKDLENAPKLTFLSAYSNYLEGHIPTFNLSKDCVDDASFLVNGTRPCTTAEWGIVPDVDKHCPSCGLCPRTSARGPVLLLHDNRLSCNLPDHLTKWAKHIRFLDCKNAWEWKHLFTTMDRHGSSLHYQAIAVMVLTDMYCTSHLDWRHFFTQLQA